MQIEALIEAVNSTNKCESRRQAARSKIEDYRSLIDKIDKKEVSFRMMFKGSQAKQEKRERMANDII